LRLLVCRLGELDFWNWFAEGGWYGGLGDEFRVSQQLIDVYFATRVLRTVVGRDRDNILARVCQELDGVLDVLI